MKYNIMRMLCMFDLPMDTADEKRKYRKFRTNLIKEGFVMIQFSVYVRTCPSREYANRLLQRVKKIVPNRGNVRIITVTEKQYDDMKILVGSKKATEDIVGSERFIVI